VAWVLCAVTQNYLLFGWSASRNNAPVPSFGAHSLLIIFFVCATSNAIPFITGFITRGKNIEVTVLGFGENIIFP